MLASASHSLCHCIRIGPAIGSDFHVEVYNIVTNSWSMAANYPFANQILMAAAVGNYVYAGGGNASPGNA